MGVRSTLSFIGALYKVELATAMEYRASFISQTIGMFLNDIFWLFFWSIFFGMFPSVGGWKLSDMMTMQAVFATGFGLQIMTLGNVRRLASMIEQGKLDYYLTMPKNVLVHSMMNLRYTGSGDIAYGLLIAVIFIPPIKWPLFIIGAILAAILIFSWGLLMHSIAFFVGRFETGARAGRDLLMLFAGYPFSVYSGWTRIFLLFIIPAGFIGGVQADLIAHWSWQWFCISVGFITLFLCLAVFVFYRGLRRYESGSSMSMRG